MRTIHPDLIPLVRRADPSPTEWHEAIITERNADDTKREHIRQTKADWAEADGGAAAVDLIFTRFDNGDLRLIDVAATLFSQNTQDDSTFTDLDRSPVFEAAHVEWRGTHDNGVEILRAKLHLNPRVNSSQPREVVTWRLEIWGLHTFYTDVLSNDGIYTPLCNAIDVAAVDTAGEVTFDYSGFSERPRPKMLRPRPDQPGSSIEHPPTSLFRLFALNKDGDAAGNVAWSVKSGLNEQVSSGQTLRRRRFTENAEIGFVDAGVVLNVPYLILENGTYTAATITFSSGNLFDLGGAPVGDVELTGLVQTPPGTSVTLGVRNDADSAYVAFTNGQFEEADLGLTSGQSRKMQVTLTPNAAGTLTPTLKALGRRAVTRIDLSRLATMKGYEDAIDPFRLTSEINSPTLMVVRDGPPDAKSKIDKLLSGNFCRDILLRSGIKDDSLSRDKWLHKDSLLVRDWDGYASHVDLKLRSPLALLKDLSPGFSPGVNYAPDGTFSNPDGWTDLAGGSTNLHLTIDELTVEDNDGIRSPLAPSSDEIIFTLPTPVIEDRRLFLDCEYGKDASGGQTIDLKIRLYNAGSLEAEVTKANIGPVRVGSTIEFSDAQIARLTDLPNVRIGFWATVSGGVGDRRAQVYWARLRTGGRREVVTYTSSSLKDTWDDLLTNRLAVPASLIGPGVEDDTTLVTKTLTGISERNPTGKNVVAKAEVEAIAYLAGGALISSQGRLKFVDCFGTDPVRAIFPARRIRVAAISPGLERRVPEFIVPYEWDTVGEDFKAEGRGFHDASILKIGTFGLGTPPVLEEEIAKWIPADTDTQTLAETIGRRTVNAFGTGEMLWSFVSVDAYPELEPGDVVAVETTSFLSRDPNLERVLKGKLWAIGRIQRIDFWGRHLTMWVQGLGDILASWEAASRIGFTVPDLYELTPNVSQTGVVTAVLKARSGKSVRVATSTSAEPSAATVRAAAIQALDGDGILRTGTLATLTAGQTLYIAAFAYERGTGEGAESKLATARITHYEGGVACSVVEKTNTDYTFTFRLQATDADGDTVKLHYRSVGVTSPSDSYTSPAPTSEGGFSTQPHGLDVTLDRGLNDRYIEAWAEDVSGNKSAIIRGRITALTSAAKAAALNTVSNATAFVGSCPTQNMEDTVTWTVAAGVPGGWLADIRRCTSGVSCTPVTVLATDQTTPFTVNFRTAVQSGVSGPDLRRYGVDLKNSYGEIVEAQDAPSGLSTTFDACP